MTYVNDKSCLYIDDPLYMNKLGIAVRCIICFFMNETSPIIDMKIVNYKKQDNKWNKDVC